MMLVSPRAAAAAGVVRHKPPVVAPADEVLEAPPPRDTNSSTTVMTMVSRELAASLISAVGYGCASLATVCLNHQVLDGFVFPSSTLILIAQVAGTLALATLCFLAGGIATTGHHRDYALVRVGLAPKLALLFVADVALGHAATRALGLDALATFRRFNIPFSLHLDTRWNRPRPTVAATAACWSMVLGPLLGLLCGRGRAKSLAQDAGSTASGAAAAYMANSASTFSWSIIFPPRGTAQRPTPQQQHHGKPRGQQQQQQHAFRLEGPWDATTWRGVALSLASAAVAAARVVLLSSALAAATPTTTQAAPPPAAPQRRDESGGIELGGRPASHSSEDWATPTTYQCGGGVVVKRAFFSASSTLDGANNTGGGDEAKAHTAAAETAPGGQPQQQEPYLERTESTSASLSSSSSGDHNNSKKPTGGPSRRRRPAWSSWASSDSAPALPSTPNEMALAIYARTAALSLPLVIAFGIIFDATGIAAGLRSPLWDSPDFVNTFLALVTMGPVHEAALYACLLHNAAVTTLVAGGFKSTAVATYRAVVAKALGGDPSNTADLDHWDALALAVSTIASLVYTYDWWLGRTAGHSADAALSGPPGHREGGAHLIRRRPQYDVGSFPVVVKIRSDAPNGGEHDDDDDDVFDDQTASLLAKPHRRHRDSHHPASDHSGGGSSPASSALQLAPADRRFQPMRPTRSRAHSGG